MVLRRSTCRVTVATAFMIALPASAQSAAQDSATVQRRQSTIERSSTLRILPVIGSAPETGFVGGATALRVSAPVNDSVTRPSTDQLYVAYTAKHQFRAFASTERWSDGNRWGLNAQLEYLRFPQPYFGIGDDAPERAEEAMRSHVAGFERAIRAVL